MAKVKTVVTGVGGRIVELIREGQLDNKAILAKVRAEHPLRKTTYACVAWYQSKLRKEAAVGGEALAAAKAKREAEEAAALEWEKREAQLLMDFEAAQKAQKAAKKK